MRIVIVLALATFSGCASAPSQEPAAEHQALAECAANAELREGESLSTTFRERAAFAHCRKTLAGDDDH